MTPKCVLEFHKLRLDTESARDVCVRVCARTQEGLRAREQRVSA